MLHVRARNAKGQTGNSGLGAAGSVMGAGWLVVGCLVVSLLIGWGLDRLLHTRPVFFVIMFPVGAAAGIYNLVQAVRRLG